MTLCPLRLAPDVDLRDALGTALCEHGASAAFVVQGIGSLKRVRLRLAGRAEPDELHGDFEILTLAGTLSPGGVHLHMTVADGDGRVLGGHVAPGCIVRTTAEVLLEWLPDHRFERVLDERTGFAELSISDFPGRNTSGPAA